MSVRIPIVLGDDGLFRPLPPGDSLSVGGTPGPGPDAPAGLVFRSENMDLPLIQAGAPVTPHPSGSGVVLAVATDNTKPAIGLAQLNIGTALSGDIQVGGLMNLPDWTPVTGTELLVPNALYFLDTVTPGRLTRTPPTARGKALQLCCKAITFTTMVLIMDQPILL